MNRGLAHRPTFESRTDVRFFLAQVARAVHRGEILVHAFCILTTHYHLFITSVEGRLSSALQRIQNEYVRWFNQTRNRDGPLFRGRFYSRPVRSEAYRSRLIRYIDDNPVAAGLSALPAAYPFGSARCYATGTGPRWLDRAWVEARVADSTARPFDAGGNLEVFGRAAGEEQRDSWRRMVESMLDPQDDMDVLLRAPQEHVRRWLTRRAKSADGPMVGPVICLPGDVTAAMRTVESAVGRSDGGRALAELQAALLFEMSGLTQTEIGVLLGVSRHWVSVACRLHRRRMLESDAYAEVCASAAREAMRMCGDDAAGALRVKARWRGPMG